MEFPFAKLLAPLKPRLEKLDRMLADPEVLADKNLYKKTAKERSDIEETLKLGEEYFKVVKNIEDNELSLKKKMEANWLVWLLLSVKERYLLLSLHRFSRGCETLKVNEVHIFF